MYYYQNSNDKCHHQIHTTNHIMLVMINVWKYKIKSDFNQKPILYTQNITQFIIHTC